MRINISIISGFLGAGKTTFLKKIIPYTEGKKVLIENEFGDIGIDGDLVSEEIPVREISGCICCSVKHDFKKAIEELALEYHPQHILIEPSGVAMLSDIINICKKINDNKILDIKINHVIVIVDVIAFDEYIDNFGGFYTDQIKHAGIILLSNYNKMGKNEIDQIISRIRDHNKEAFILKDEWYDYNGESLLDIANTIQSKEIAYIDKKESQPANRIFTSFSIDRPKIFYEDEIEVVLNKLKDHSYGHILRGKGFLQLNTNRMINFNFTPHQIYWKYIEGVKDSKAVFIGGHLNTEKILEMFVNE